MLQNKKNEYLVRENVNKIIKCFESCEDINDFQKDISGPIKKFLSIKNLSNYGINRQGNNVKTSKYLYFDCQYSFLLFEIQKDQIIPPHDHGITEILCVYEGKLKHNLYKRIDDQNKKGFAKLKSIQSKEISSGDFVIVNPPNDIHSFKAVDNKVIGITVINGEYKLDRHYYNIENNSYKVITTVNSR